MSTRQPVMFAYHRVMTNTLHPGQWAHLGACLEHAWGKLSTDRDMVDVSCEH